MTVADDHACLQPVVCLAMLLLVLVGLCHCHWVRVDMRLDMVDNLGCLVPLKISSFFTLSIISIFSRLYEVLNVGKK
jgi:hypothetical protein